MSKNPASYSPEQELTNRLKDAERNINELAARIYGSSAGSGTVTSVQASGGTTGLTFSGGPVTTTGTLTMAGTLAIANGGTGATTAAGAIAALGLDADLATLSLPASTTISAFGATLVDDANAAAGRATLGLATSDDNLTQYALLAGRATPQQLALGTASGASTGYFTSTAHATKGKYFLNSAGTITVDELNARFGVGIASPASKLQVSGTETDASAIDVVTGVTAGGALNINHFRSTVTMSTDDTMQFIRAVGTFIPSVANTSTQYAMNNNLQVGTAAANSNNVSGDIFGQFIRISTGSGYTGTLTRFTSQYIGNASLAGGGALTTQAGMVIQNLAAGTNNTQLALGATVAQVPTGNWALYSRSANDSAFAGNVRIGSTTAPTVALDVTGAAKISTTLAVTGATTLATSLTGLLKAASGVVSAASAGTDYYNPGGTDVAVADGGTGASTKAAGFDALSPMTTSGDIIYGGASGTGTRLAKGTDGQALILASGVPSWSSLAGASLDINGLTADATPDPDADYIPTYDASAGVNKKILPSKTFPWYIGHVLDSGDRTTTATTDGTATAIAALTWTFTVVSGAIYRIRAGQESYNSGANTGYLQIWQGTVGSGTKKAEKAQFHSAGSAFFQHICEYIGTLTAGSQTVNVGIKTSAGTQHLYGTGVNSFLTIERLT